jgi:hypothetical protein
MRTGSGGWWVPSDRYIPSEVEVLRVIAYSDGTTPQIKQMGIGFTRIEVIDESGRAYVNTSARDVDVALEDDGRTLKIFTGGTGFTPRPGESSGHPSIPRIEVIDDTGRAYVNTVRSDVEAALERIEAGGQNLQWDWLHPRHDESSGQCSPDEDAINERADARARELLERLWDKLDGKDDTK